MTAVRSHDWHKLVRDRISTGALPASERDEIVSELAAHLEEAYEAALGRGLNDPAACELALREVDDWNDLGESICRAKSTEALMNPITRRYLLPAIAALFSVGLTLMFLDRDAMVQRLIWMACMVILLCAAAFEANRLSHRGRCFWLPGFVSLTVAGILLLSLEQVIEPWIFFREISLRPQDFVRFHAGWRLLAWLCAQVIFGALAAFFSRRAGGTRSYRIFAGAFPAIVIVGTYVMLIPVTARFAASTGTGDLPAYLGSAMLVWVMAPGVAIFIGAAPFLGGSRPEPKFARE